jgi:hypothetical protein
MAAAILRMAWLKGKFQGENAAHHADGLAQHHLAHAGHARRDHAAVDAAALLGVPLGGARRSNDDLADGLGQRLAHGRG